MNKYSEMAMAKNMMMNAMTEDEAFDNYCKCCDIRQELFPGKCGMTDCDHKCWLTRDYNDVVRAIRKRNKGVKNVTFNLFGCNVTINVNGGDDEKDK